jgi:hypothetical protein
MGSAYAFIVGIEKYLDDRISQVHYAHEDARGFRDVLIERMEVPSENIKLWLDQQAVKAKFENDLKYEVSQLGPEDRFYFFFAGHGLWASKGGNKLAAWDMHPDNQTGTSVSLEEVLLGPLRESKCQHSVVFIDACAAEFTDALAPRDLVSSMSKREFQEFIKESIYTAAFFSCSEKEKSYPDFELKHGIWTYHLLKALRGEAPEAIVKDRWVTGDSLRDYLKESLRVFTRNKIVGAAKQRPYALIGASGTFPIVEIPEVPAYDGTPALAPDFSKAYFASEETRGYKSLPGYSWKKKHFVPESHTDGADSFARSLLAAQVAQELQTVASHAKEIFELKSRDVNKREDTGSDAVDTDAFRFSIESGQSADDPGEAFIRRKIVLRVPDAELPEEFDGIFPTAVEEFVVPIPGTRKQYQNLIDAIEDGAEVTGAKTDGDQTKGTIDVDLPSGIHLVIDTEEETMIVRVAGTDGCLRMIDRIRKDGLPGIAPAAPKLIGRKRSK